MRNLNLILGLCLALITTSCKKDRLNAEKEILVGTWNWQLTDFSHYCDGGLEYETFNPTTENTTYKIEFLKKGYIRFYKNEILESEHLIRFNTLSIQKEGIVPSNKEIEFEIYLDGDANNRIRAKGTQKGMIISYYPFKLEEDCHHWIRNYFKKEM